METEVPPASSTGSSSVAKTAGAVAALGAAAVAGGVVGAVVSKGHGGTTDSALPKVCHGGEEGGV